MTENRMLDALLAECRELETRVSRGEAKLMNLQVGVKPPDPLPRKRIGPQSVQRLFGP